MAKDDYKTLCKNVESNCFFENYTLEEQSDIWFHRDVTSHLYTFDFMSRCRVEINKIQLDEVSELYKKLF